MSRRLKIFILVLLVAVVGLASIPLWLPLALRPILRRKAITFESYERMGYAHFRLRNARYENTHVVVTASDVQSPTPLLWLVQRLRGNTPPSLSVADWAVTILPHAPAPVVPTARPTVGGPADLEAVFRRIEPPLQRWLPRAQLHRGRIVGLPFALPIDEGDWRNGSLNLTGVRVTGQSYALGIAPAEQGAFTVSARTAGNDARVQLAWTNAAVKGDGFVWDQPVQVSAIFPEQGWLPADASAIAAKWSVPARRAKLGALYATVHGEARLLWHNHALDFSFEAAADPAPNTKAPPLSARAQAHGTLHEFTVTSLEINAPFATAQLSAPVTFSRDRPVAAVAAQLTVQADLGKLPWMQARGEVKGTLSVTGDTATTRQSFDVEFSNVELPGLVLKKGRATGSLLWPQLELTSLHAQLDEASSIDAHGIIDWRRREVRGVAAKAKLDSAWLSRWLPAGVAWDSAELSLTAEGPLGAPRHQGSLSMTQVRWSSSTPMAVTATWQGAGAKADAVSARIVAEHSSIDLDGSLTPTGFQLDKLQFSAAGQKIWQLGAVARLAWSPVWEIDPLQLTGPDSSIMLKASGSSQGTLELTTGRIDSAWLQDWIKAGGPAWQIHSLQSSGRIVDGALVFDAALAAQVVTPSQPAEVKLTVSGDAEGLRLKELTVTQSGRVLTHATGRIPVRWQMQATPHLQLDESAPLELSASTDPDSPLWEILAGSTGLQLTHPEAKINLTGTLRQPAGDLQVRVEQMKLALKNSRISLPEIEDLAIDAHVDRSQVTLRNLSARLEGQAVQASGQLPMKDEGWQQLWQHPTAFDWSEAEGKLDIPDADLAALARNAPNLVAALGRLSAHVELARGEKFSGELKITDASSRPLPPFGTFQEINADLVFAERTLTVRSLKARMGGEPVSLDGRVTFRPGASPLLALNFKGNRLPIVRASQLLVRSDLDLQVTTNEAGVTRITGHARPRDSLALANFNSLLPSGPKGVTRVPPYFSVQAEPFRHWLLDVDVRGPAAVKIRTTVFNGTASAQFHLTGTLGDPRAVGELSVDQGQVLFPFAAFHVQQGAVRLSEADSFHARINLVATSQRRDYQLRLEVTGQLPNPVITMSSTPALEATDVLLMVMTGRPPTTDTATSSTQRLALLGAYLGKGLFEDFGADSEDRLEISSGEQITYQGRETYEIEYKLGARWSLVGEYDQFDSYNADVKRRIYIQESTPREQK